MCQHAMTLRVNISHESRDQAGGALISTADCPCLLLTRLPSLLTDGVGLVHLFLVWCVSKASSSPDSRWTPKLLQDSEPSGWHPAPTSHRSQTQPYRYPHDAKSFMSLLAYHPFA